ncbi:hypothetical protein Mapa_004362 [Marchantia paleacea]|nr:hypothetical protein Mapa_004362 [Marchantia paleacea]
MSTDNHVLFCGPFDSFKCTIEFHDCNPPGQDSAAFECRGIYERLANCYNVRISVSPAQSQGTDSMNGG